MIFTCYITFTCRKGKHIPWHMTLTSVTAEYKIVHIGLLADDLIASYVDYENHDRTVDDYLEHIHFEFDYKFDIFQFENELDTVVNYDLAIEGEDLEIIAIDVDTYHFLLKALPHIKLSWLKSNFADRTLATAYRHSFDKNGFANYSHTIQISFIQFRGDMIPYHLSITSTTPPYKTTLIGLSIKDLNFKGEEYGYNKKRVDHFPRPDSFLLDYEWSYDTFENNFLSDEFREILFGEGWLQILVFDITTYHYLVKIMDVRELDFKKSTRPISEDRTLAAAYRLFNKIENPLGTF